MTEKTVPTKPCLRCGTVFPATLEFFHKVSTRSTPGASCVVQKPNANIGGLIVISCLRGNTNGKGNGRRNTSGGIRSIPTIHGNGMLPIGKRFCTMEEEIRGKPVQLITQASVNNVSRTEEGPSRHLYHR